METHLGLRHPYHQGDSRNGTERVPSLRMLRIVPSNRRLRFDGPPNSASAHSECYTAASAVPSLNGTRGVSECRFACYKGSVVMAIAVSTAGFDVSLSPPEQ